MGYIHCLQPMQVRRIIEADLGQPVESLYASFEWTPIASASLAQVVWPEPPMCLFENTRRAMSGAPRHSR